MLCNHRFSLILILESFPDDGRAFSSRPSRDAANSQWTCYVDTRLSLADDESGVKSARLGEYVAAPRPSPGRVHGGYLGDLSDLEAWSGGKSFRIVAHSIPGNSALFGNHARL